MKKNMFFIGLTLFLMGSCKDEVVDLPETSFIGTYVGKHVIESFNFKDTLLVEHGSDENDGQLVITSKLLDVSFDGTISATQISSELIWHNLAIDASDTILHAHGDVNYSLKGGKLSQEASIDVETNILGYENPGKITLLGDFIKL